MRVEERTGVKADGDGGGVAQELMAERACHACFQRLPLHLHHLLSHHLSFQSPFPSHLRIWIAATTIINVEFRREKASPSNVVAIVVGGRKKEHEEKKREEKHKTILHQTLSY